MLNSQDMGQVLSLRAALLEGDEGRQKQQRDAGKLLARERIQKLADSGSFVELFTLMSGADGGAGVVTGYATVRERPVYIFAQDFTVSGGAMGQKQAQKINQLLDMAVKTGAPVLMLCDSAGVKLDEGALAMDAYSQVYSKLARMSGVCPMISVVLGPCVGGAALISQLSDVCVMARSVGSLMVYGPQVINAMNGTSLEPAKLGGADVMAEQGACALVADDESGALALASKLLDLLPSCNAEDAPLEETDDLNRLLPDVDADDAVAVMNAMADDGSLLELYADYQPSIRTALCRMGGRVAALVATDKKSGEGKLTAGALKKAARFVRFADCYGLPILSLINTKGVYFESVAAQTELLKAQSCLLYAYAEATAPKLAVVTGDAIGQAYVAMGGKGNADVTYAWPGAVISALQPEAAVAVLYGKQVKEDAELTVEQAREKYAKQYVADVAGALQAAKSGVIDDVIDPAQTRALLLAAMEMLASKRDSNPPKKHGNLPM